MTDEYTPTTEEVMRGFRIGPVIDPRTGETLLLLLTRRQKERWLEAHDAQVAAQALRDAVRYARPDGGDHVGMTRSEAEAFEDALTLVEEYAAHLLGEGS